MEKTGQRHTSEPVAQSHVTGHFSYAYLATSNLLFCNAIDLKRKFHKVVNRHKSCVSQAIRIIQVFKTTINERIFAVTDHWQVFNAKLPPCLGHVAFSFEILSTG